MIVIRLKKQAEHCDNKREKNISESPYPVRTRFIVNGELHYLIDISKSDLKSAELLRVVSAYKGRIVVTKELENVELFKNSLADISPSLREKCFSELLGQLKRSGNKNASLCIKNTEECFSLDLDKVVCCVKSITVICADTHFFSDYPKKCYREYGVKPTVIFDGCGDKRVSPGDFDIYADFDTVFENGYLKYSFFSEEKTIVPQYKNRILDGELKMLYDSGVRREYIYSLFCQD